MNYIKSAKYRKFKSKMKRIFSLFNFKFKNFDNSSIVIFLGAILGIVSLFLPWGIVNDSVIFSFNRVIGAIGFLILFFNLLILFILFSNNIKEQIKVSIKLKLKDKYILLFSSLIVFILTFTSYQCFVGLSMLYENIFFLSGIKLSFLSGIITLVGFFFYYRKKEDLYVSIHVKGEDIENSFNKDKNMKLPF